MTQIIDFTSFRDARPSRATPPSGNAEILFFLGVRYERMSDTPQTPSPRDASARSGKRVRKRRA